MNDYPFERSPIVHPAGTVLSITVYGVIKHFGIATGYGTVIHTSRRFGRVEETDFFVMGGTPISFPMPRPYRAVRLWPAPAQNGGKDIMSFSIIVSTS